MKVFWDVNDRGHLVLDTLEKTKGIDLEVRDG